MTEQPHDNHGIVITGHARVSDSALAAGTGAHAVRSGPSTEELRLLVADFRSLLEEQRAAGAVTPEQHRTADEATRAVDEELEGDRPGRLQVITLRLRELGSCLAGTGVLAQAAGELGTAIRSLTG